MGAARRASCARDRRDSSARRRGRDPARWYEETAEQAPAIAPHATDQMHCVSTAQCAHARNANARAHANAHATIFRGLATHRLVVRERREWIRRLDRRDGHDRRPGRRGRGRRRQLRDQVRRPQFEREGLGLEQRLRRLWARLERLLDARLERRRADGVLARVLRRHRLLLPLALARRHARLRLLLERGALHADGLLGTQVDGRRRLDPRRLDREHPRGRPRLDERRRDLEQRPAHRLGALRAERQVRALRHRLVARHQVDRLALEGALDLDGAALGQFAVQLVEPVAQLGRRRLVDLAPRRRADLVGEGEGVAAPLGRQFERQLARVDLERALGAVAQKLDGLRQRRERVARVLARRGHAEGGAGHIVREGAADARAHAQRSALGQPASKHRRAPGWQRARHSSGGPAAHLAVAPR